MRRILLPMLLAALVMFPAAARPPTASSAVELAAGISFTRDNEDTQVVSAAWLPRFRAIGSGLMRWDIGVTHVRGRDHSRYDNADDVTIAHLGLRYERPGGLIAGFGVGVQSGWSEALSGNPQFISTFGWRWGQFSLLARHISNASIHQPNDGETMLQAAWRF